MVFGLSLMGLTYGSFGTLVAELFPTQVRYTGSSIAVSMAGTRGFVCSYSATSLAKNYGMHSIGYYVTSSAIAGEP